MRKALAGILTFTLALASLALPAPAQQANLSRVAGVFVASQYSNWRMAVVSGSAAAGAYSIVLAQGAVVLPDGRNIVPFAANAPISIGQGATAETVTPSAVSGCTFAQATPSCTITATFTYAHGAGDAVTSGTNGLQEAINDAAGWNGSTINSTGGEVVVDKTWLGTNAMLSAASPFWNVSVLDYRTGLAYWTPQPTTIAALATPATRSASAGTTQVIDSATAGTFANAANYFCVTYVDMMGQESPCSASFNYTPAGNLAVFWNTPAASTGAVGWIPYAGITGTSTQYRITPTSSICTLSTLVNVVAACAIGSNATTLGPVTTTSLAPGETANTYRPVMQSSSAWGYAKGSTPHPGFRNQFGPFIASSTVAATEPQVLATVNVPSGFFSAVNKTVRISGKIAETMVNTATQPLVVRLGPAFSTGTPTAVCTVATTTALTTAAYGAYFECTLTTNAATTIMPSGFLITQLTAGTTTASAVGVDTGTAAISNSGLATASMIYITNTLGTAGASDQQILSLTIEQLN